ncbi:hypothetical protein FEF65_10725 [Mariprofundus erugo]|uniref:Uncharacterized protein n=1 Tax=Mariprofundus erugo TaxID=2528639 RepID=A0A5R9GJ83_9PROT|nr:hypothetical protein [Mariprofundus erugo]TLS66280.1 hypothetical protein FEF65_10725 [Mariprofundus erugo]
MSKSTISILTDEYLMSVFLRSPSPESLRGEIEAIEALMSQKSNSVMSVYYGLKKELKSIVRFNLEKINDVVTDHYINQNIDELCEKALIKLNAALMEREALQTHAQSTAGWRL